MEASITSTKNFVWIGNNLAEERDENNNVTRRFYPQGEQISGANYYYTRDQLGSIRELVDSTQAIRARYDYDPYGKRTKLSGDLDAEFGYTGHYYHQPSGLDLTLYRAYDPTIGRWLSRDPIAENGGVNLYAYVMNSPDNATDPLGLRDIYIGVWGPRFPFGALGYGSIGHVGAFELDGRVIASQFPNPHASEGVNTRLPYADTVDAEGGRLPDSVYKIYVPDDAAFDRSIQSSVCKSKWYWSGEGTENTNCTHSVGDALTAGGVPVPWDIWPGDWPLNLKPMIGVANVPWKVTRMSVNSIPFRL